MSVWLGAWQQVGRPGAGAMTENLLLTLQAQGTVGGRELGMVGAFQLPSPTPSTVAASTILPFPSRFTNWE